MSWGVLEAPGGGARPARPLPHGLRTGGTGGSPASRGGSRPDSRGLEPGLAVAGGQESTLRSLLQFISL